MRIFITTVFCGLFLGISSANGQDLQQFTLLDSEQTGIDFNNEVRDLKETNILKYANFYGGAGVGVGDFNNDGLEDVFFAGNFVPDRLYFNQGDFKFKDVTTESGIVHDGGWSTGVTVADINNDGFLDIYISRELYDHKPEWRANQLYINNGDGTFKERAKEFGVDNSQRTRHATFVDIDNDGFLDLFLLTQPPNPGSYSEYFGTELLQPEYSTRMYRNIGGKKFIDITMFAGLNRSGFPNAVSASDFNNDGYTDLFVSNDFYAADALYINNGDGTFRDIVSTAFNHLSYFSMGVDVADINDDGNLDIFVLDMVAEDNFRLKRNMSGMNPDSFWKVVNDGNHFQYMFNNLHLNNGNETFSEIAQLTHMAATDWSWANLIADFDNDGKKDIFISNGLLRDIRNTDASKAVGKFVTDTANEWVKENPDGGDVSIWDILDIDKALEILPSVPISNYMYRNDGNFEFTKVAKEWGLDTESFSQGAAYADFDNDGDLDLIMNNMNHEAFVYRNNADRNYVRLSLKSRQNKPVFGTRVALTANGTKQFIETTNVRGIYSTSENSAHFGLDGATIVDEVVITWPGGHKTILNNVDVNREIEVYLEDAVTASVQTDAPTSTIFKEITESPLILEHTENAFDDYEYQVLLPHKLSQFGPSMATADVNGDGLTDLFFGGATGYASRLLLQQPDGNFVTGSDASFIEDKIYEDIDAVFFDVDNDNDMDLYVVSGGNEFRSKDERYKDRLYLNNGQGTFTRAEAKVESGAISGSVAIPCDFDKDGDMDMFVGGRLSPRDYPTPTDSKLLENVNGELLDVTKRRAQELNELGMVTDALWSDYDKDGDMDLLIVGEWMPVTVMENNAGTFMRKTFPGLTNSEGWWFSIDEGDFDNDGDMDYVLGNLGLNYKYKATPEEPFDVYYDDFDKNGKYDIVLGYYNFGQHFPVRGFSCSSEQIPELKTEFKKYDVFAALDLDQIYGEKNLKKALYFKANNFASSYMENLGGKDFTLAKLPVQSQFSSVNDMLIEDFNKDGNLDLLVIGNLFVSEIETSRNDAGTGLLLYGDGQGKFNSVALDQSGFFSNKDAKKIRLIENAGRKLILVANNDDKIQVFEWQ